MELDVGVVELEKGVGVPFLDCADDGQHDLCVAHEGLRSPGWTRCEDLVNDHIIEDLFYNVPLMTVELAARAARLRDLHESGLLVIPNVWDAATAELFEELGFPAVATASAAVCASLGCPDGSEIPPGEMFAAVGRIAASTEVPVSADLED